MKAKVCILFFACLTSTAMAQQFVGFEKTIKIEKAVPSERDALVPLPNSAQGFYGILLELYSKHGKVGEFVCNENWAAFLALGKGKDRYKYDEKTLRDSHSAERPYQIYRFKNENRCEDMVRAIASQKGKAVSITVNDASGEIETVRPAASSSAR
jgi:hypothetical protein